MISASGSAGGASGSASLVMRVTWRSGGGAIGPCGASWPRAGIPGSRSPITRTAADRTKELRVLDKDGRTKFIASWMRQIPSRAASLFSPNYSLSHSCRGAEVRPRPRPGRNKKSLLQFRGSVSETKQAKRYFVSGMVQGVGYRYYTLAAAEKLRVSGFVRNLSDGRVEVFAVGTPQQHGELRSMLERGPRFSSVSEVREEPAILDAQDRAGFFIDHSDY